MHQDDSNDLPAHPDVLLDAREILSISEHATPDQVRQAFEHTQARYEKLTGVDPWVHDAVRQAYVAITSPASTSSDESPRRLSFSENLPLQNETTYFILVNVMDIFMTYLLLNLGAVEANPVAAFFIDSWGFSGMIAFKLVLVAAVCVISQVVATRRLSYARGILWTGIVVVGIVVVYSLRLLVGQTT